MVVIVSRRRIFRGFTISKAFGDRKILDLKKIILHMCTLWPTTIAIN